MKMEMLLKDYGKILVRGLCNSHPDLYTDFFNRQFKALNKEDYSNKEIKHKISAVFDIIKSRIKEIYESELKAYNRYKAADKGLPVNKRYNYPKPNINEIPILFIKYPSGHKDDLSGLSKKFYLHDIEILQKAAFEILDNTTTTEKSTKPSKLTILLKLYFEKGQKSLTKPQVEKVAAENNISKTGLVNKWIQLKADYYTHNGNVNNIKEFVKSYKYLLSHTQDTNPVLHKSIYLEYEKLISNYPDLAL